MPRLENKYIVLIGGTAGIGLSAARACVREGAKVVVVGRNADKCDAAAKELGAECSVSLVGDAANPETSKQAIELCVETWGDFDGLYHVAGGSGRRMGDGPLHEVTDKGIQATLEINLHGLMYANRAAVQKLRELGHGGSILNMTSVLGYSPAPKFFSTHVYAAAKSAVYGFTQSIAAYYATEGIRVNAIAPALVETPMAQRAATNDTIQAYIQTKQPLEGGRIGVPEDLDGAALYFLSDESRFTTGQTLTVDGGWSVSEGQYPEE